MSIFRSDSFQSFRKIATPFAVVGLLAATLIIPALLGQAGAAEEVISTCEVETAHGEGYMLQANSVCDIPSGTDITRAELEVWLDDGGAVFVDGREIYGIGNDPGMDHDIRSVNTGLTDGDQFSFEIEARNAFENDGSPMGDVWGRAILRIYGESAPQNPVLCTGNQTVNVGQTASFTASGGNGSYSWSGGGNPATGSGSNFSTSYSTAGARTVTVTSAGGSDTCSVNVNSVSVTPGPTTLSGSCTGGNSPQVNLSWHSVPNQNSNGVQKRVNGGDWAFVGPVPLGVVSYTDLNVSFGNTYEYRVKTDPQVASNIVTVPVSTASCGGTVDTRPQGFLDAANCDFIGGWASDSDTPNQPVSVHLYADGPAGSGTFLMSTLANIFRSDVGNHAFHVVTPQSLKNGQSHTIYAYGINSNPSGENALLNGSPKSFTCAVNNVPTADIKANGSDGPVTIAHNSAATISWTSTNATSCTVTPGGWTGTSGSQSSGNLTGSQTYSLSCSGPGGTATDSVTVNVSQVAQLTCSPASQNVNVNQAASFTASGGTGSYSWSGGGAPSTGAGTTFSTSFASAGNHNVAVSSGGQTAFCLVNVSQVNNPPTADIKANGSDGPITINHNTAATISWTSTNATSCTVTPGGWTGTSGSQSSGNLTSSQTYSVSCSGPGGTATDSVTVNVSQVAQLTCSPGSQNANVNQTVYFTASGGTGSYNWTASDGNPSTGSGATFNTNYSASGNRNVSVTSGGQTAFCFVNVNQVNNPPTADIKANGSDGTVTIPFNSSANITWTSQNATNCTVSPTGWTGTSGSQSSGSLTSNVTYFLSCSGPGGTATDSVTVNVNQQNNLSCNPFSQTANVNQNVYVYASGGSGSYSWFAPNGNPSSGFGSSLTTNYSNSGNYIINVTSGGQTASCSVNVGGGGQANNLQVTKNVLNRTTNQTFYSNSIEAQGLDVLEFEIRVRNADTVGGNVTVQDILPSQLFYVPNSTTVDGQTVADGIVGSGYNLGHMYPNQEKIIKFRATVYYGTTPQLVTNQARATMGSGVQNAYASINIRNRGQVLGVADIVTGPGDYIPWVLAFGFLGSIASYAGIFRYRLIRLADGGNGPVSELQELVLRIRESEKRPDTGPHLRT